MPYQKEHVEWQYHNAAQDKYTAFWSVLNKHQLV